MHVRYAWPVSSLRFGPDPADLPLAEPPRGSGPDYPVPDHTLVRFRSGGRWRLGVLRAWRHVEGGWIIQVEARDLRTGAVMAPWYRFVAESVDPLGVDAKTGEVVLVPPERRSLGGQAPH